MRGMLLVRWLGEQGTIGDIASVAMVGPALLLAALSVAWLTDVEFRGVARRALRWIRESVATRGRSPDMSDRGVRIAVLQRVCADYRVGLFSALGSVGNVEMRLFIGHDLPGTKVKGVGVCPGVSVTKLETRFIRLGRRILPVHVGLVDELRKFRPTVVLCEGESHFVGYLQAIYYRLRYDRRRAVDTLVLYCVAGSCEEKVGRGGAPSRRISEGISVRFSFTHRSVGTGW